MSVSFTRPLAKRKSLRAGSPARKIRVFRLICLDGPLNSAASSFVFGKVFHVQSGPQQIAWCASECAA